MKILAPVNRPQETAGILAAGADELYCGVLPQAWMDKFSNIASANRREWKTANLTEFSDLQKIVRIAHGMGKKVNFALNALYTVGQYPLVLEHAQEAENAGADAIIVADVGLLVSLRKKKFRPCVHVSTGGTTFNSETARFYEDLGVSRIILPRHLRVDEIAGIVRDCPSLQFEVFILNSGCKNIDGFCTFHHGLREMEHPYAWNIPKKLNCDRYVLNAIRSLPRRISRKIKGGMFGIDSACLLNYAVCLVSAADTVDGEGKRRAVDHIRSSFSLLSGIDPCGACRLAEFRESGVYGVKIVGRNYSTRKKISDVRFLSELIFFLEHNNVTQERFREHVLETFRRIYKMGCGKLCYYPDGM